MNSQNKKPLSIWSVDRIGRLIVGLMSIVLIVCSIFISKYFLFGLAVLNINLILTSITDACPFRDFLKSLGAKEREEIIDANGNLINQKSNIRFDSSFEVTEKT